MPVYEYEHIEMTEPCSMGVVFDVRQSINDPVLEICPICEQKVKRIISRVNINTPKTNSDLKDLGFTKLVRRDDGVYENVTRRGNESRYMEKDKPETMPRLDKTIRD